jgi:hypothetical protein
MKDIIEWSNKKPIRELINQLIDLEVKGYTDVELILENEMYEPDGCEGQIEYEEVAKLKVF